MNSSTHSWKFFRAGGFDQVRLDRGADLMRLAELDQKLWVALACPTRGLEFDSKTLDLIDTDKDGRIRPPELIAAAQWAGARLKTPDTLVAGGALALDAIQDSTPEGKRLLASAKQVLTNLGRPAAKELTVADTDDTVAIFAQTKFNGDGIVPADASSDPALHKLIGEVIACEGGRTDRSGKLGLDQAKLDAFYAHCQDFAGWSKRGLAKEVAVLGDKTAVAAAALAAVKSKVDDYFSRCHLAAFDTRATEHLNRSESEFLALAAKDLSIDAAEVAHFPLARVVAGQPLPLNIGLNPAWSARLGALQVHAIEPLLGARSALSEADWNSLQARLAGFQAWQASKACGAVEGLGLARVQEILAAPHKAAVESLLAEDRKLEPEASSIRELDQLVRLQRDLLKLATNFVNFKDFYSRSNTATFQAGRLYLDERSCDLCIRVDDLGKHSGMSPQGLIYLAYVDCVRNSDGAKMTIAAAFTDGDSDNLSVGRNGVFYDRSGKDWDATIVKLVDQPISIRQAFWSPYKKVAKLIEGQIEKIAASKDKAVEAAAASKVDAGAAAATSGSAPPKESFDIGKSAGILAMVGLAIGAIGGFLTAVVSGFAQLALWQLPLAILGLMLAISTPACILAWLKLRKRNLGPLLDANGWAVNAKAKLNIPFGKSLTRVASLPAGSQRDLSDPYAQKNGGRNTLIALFAVALLLGLAWYYRLALQFSSAAPSWTHRAQAQSPVPAAAGADSTPPAPGN